MAVEEFTPLTVGGADASTSDNILTVIEDSSSGPFEGPEKLLELWWAASEHDVPTEIKGGRKGKARYTGLRQVEKPVWDSMLDEVQCKVLSVVEGEEMDAYLLSESSMFVWPHKLILKTCGTTTLLLGLPTLLRIAAETCGFKGVWRCFYSRKTFMFPDRQRGPHKDWAQEMNFLDQLFENSSAYTVGRMNGDHWLLYLTPPRDDVLIPAALDTSASLPAQTPSTSLSTLSASFKPPLARQLTSGAPPPHLPNLAPRSHSTPDQTLEILMTGLHPSVCESFYHPDSSPSNKSAYTTPLLPDAPISADAHSLGSDLSDRLGITTLFPAGTALDSFLFAPCGYSSNAVNGDRYATIHVTPEVEYSYASFETNLDYGLSPIPSSSNSTTTAAATATVQSPSSLQDLIERVLGIFRPAKLSMTLFVSVEDNDNGEERAHVKGLLNPDLDGKYERVDRIVYEFEGYSLVYAVWTAVPEVSSAPAAQVC